MKFLESWLRECFDEGLKNLSGEQLCTQLTNAGLEVDSYENGIIDIQLTPNRGDCASIYGVAREVALANPSSKLLNQPPPQPAADTPPLEGNLNIQIIAKQECPLYITATIKGINLAAQTPDYMITRLIASGNKAIHPVVDILNYVMLELGQPMHAFDAKGLEKGLMVDKLNSPPEEGWQPADGVLDKLERTTVELLNDQSITVQPGTLVIRKAEDQSILALAGIMGAKQNSVTPETQDILLEAAHFEPDAIRGRARNHGLQTDASYRFERGVDPALPPIAMQRAIDLILEIAGGKIVAISNISTIPSAYGCLLSSGGKFIVLRSSRIQKILGIEISKEKVESILKGLQMQVSFDESKQSWQVTPPSFRFDIAIEEDLIEEVARIIGYNNLPTKLPILPTRMLPLKNQAVSLIDLKKRLQARDYHEAISYSFVEPALQNTLNPDLKSWALSNPISPELSVMRTSLWASLIPILLHNQKRQQARIRLFESGLRFVFDPSGIDQIPTLAGLAWGQVVSEQWASPKRNLDFYDIKSDVENLLSHLGDKVKYTKANHPALHPGRSAAIELAGKQIGYVGAFHPKIEQDLGLSGLYGFELDLNSILQKEIFELKSVSKFPMVRRDLAFIVDTSIQVADLKREIITALNSSLDSSIITLLSCEVNLFDLYQGKGIPENKKSMAFSLILQRTDRTLSDEEEILIKAVIKHLEKTFNATLRD